MRLLLMIPFALLLSASTSQFARGGDSVPCSCLQELLADYPGPYDAYLAISHVTSCNDVGEEVVWYGLPSNSTLPQQCGLNVCEEYQGENGRTAAIIPGHGQELVGIKAWEVFRIGLESAARKSPGLEFGTPSYFVIPRKSLPAKMKATRDIVVMAVPLTSHMKDTHSSRKTSFFCIQIDSADGLPLSKIVFDNIKVGPGQQLIVQFRPKAGEVHRGLVWLK